MDTARNTSLCKNTLNLSLLEFSNKLFTVTCQVNPDFKQKSKIPKNSNAISKRIGPHCDIHSRQLGNNNFHSLRMRMTTSSNAPKTQARTHYGFSYFTLYSNNDMTTSSYHIRIVRVSQNLCLTCKKM